ncbi:flavodoxin family protein [Clostridium beijerinckii]|jgi:Multimeric flavodoxin WrbA|uniref:Flavodoxin family protein n=2 Tax=Clostridium beijerinckii TaxID=1520 RepID=A0AAE2RQX3_CLOBE|nr:flavodoxin family protein [Clostridium beijerinckii]ABR35480.1 NADPH-dependent FMN reductase [Clostridium beijerinckii NCIMB 8052]AIU02869.1 NADPH-dependent FMN reductase [Clostridium beijerinckii ATCC 35702]MBF7809878.1 flavodoxin family protein [Clostridium beijerinckii]NRT69330.1 multimeric flavodoxin WrbA [Clostridium beijerinckii]NRT84522.1 multimeric flavodoxin WrbA [Clostridium beijerinckii]
MKVVAFNGSPKKNGNTYEAIKAVAEELKKENIDVEIVHVGNKVIRGCMACGGCARNMNEKCVMQNDEVNDWIQKMKDADGIILGSPVHYSAIAGTMKSFLDRAFYVTSVNNGMLRHKVGASVVAVRRSGGVPTFTQLNNYLNYSEMLMPTSNYWNVVHGTAPGEAVQDEEGMQIMRVLGKNMAWLLKLADSGKANVEESKGEEKIFTNFIR